MHFRDCDLSFALMKQNCVIDNSLPPITKENWSLTFLLLITKKSFMKYPPGLVVTRASYYSCVFSKTRREQEFSVISDEKNFKPTLDAKFGDHIRQWEKVMAKKVSFTSPSNFFTFSKIYLAPKYIQLHLEIDRVYRKMKYTCSIYWWNYCCLVCMGVWLIGTSS